MALTKNGPLLTKNGPMALTKSYTRTHLLILRFKGWAADEEFVHENADGPMIDFLIVTPIFHHFGRQVIQCTAKRLSAR